MKSTVRRALLLGLVPFAAVALAACGDTSHDPGMSGHGSSSMPSMSAGASGAMADVQFAQMMIVHHRQAVEMSTLAETRAADPEVKALAAKIKAAQEPEIAQMTGWLTTWGKPTMQAGGHDMPGMGAMPGLMTDAEMRQLQAATGAAFDKMFTTLMIAHHEGAVTMANDVLATTSSAEVKALAEAIVSAQKAEIAQMRKMLERL